MQSDHTERVKPASEGLERLYETMVADLDPDQLGFGWWQSYLDRPRVALISEYLCASVFGLRSAVENAAFVLKEFEESTFADDTWTRTRLGTRAARQSEEAALRALSRSGNDARRARRIELHREHFFYHLAQTLDRLAATVIGTAGLGTSILKADWRDVADDERFARAAKRAPQSSVGEDRQQEVRERVTSAMTEAGPDNWLEWVDAVRNTNAHRAPKVRMNALTQPTKSKPVRIVQLFDRQPGWSQTEAMVGSEEETLWGVWLPSEPGQLMAALLDAVTEALAAITIDLEALWADRRDDPALIVQPELQWPKILSEKPLSFPGLGENAPINVDGGKIRVSPSSARRLQASGIFKPDVWR